MRLFALQRLPQRTQEDKDKDFQMAKAIQRADYGLRAAARAPLAARARSLQPFGRHRVTPVAVRPMAAQSKLLPEVKTDPPGTTRYAAEPHDTCFDLNDSSTGRA